MEVFELFFDDLTEAAQRRILDAYGIEEPEEANWDIYPITEIVVDNAYDEDEEDSEEEV